MNKEFAVTFDDVLITPRFSEVGSRKEVDLNTTLVTKNGNKLILDLPVISANMSTITEAEMCVGMSLAGGMGIIHRFISIEDNVKQFKAASYHCTNIGVSIGVSKDEKERAEALISVGAKIFCIDVAHGAQRVVLDQYLWLRNKYGSDLTIIVGNFATPDTIETFDRLSSPDKPDLYKVGIGPGSVCSTRQKTGVGVPQFAAIMSCAKQFPGKIIADGGMKTPGDIAKALGAGAVAVMLGGMLSGTKETPGEKVIERSLASCPQDHLEINDVFKIYKGSASDGYGNGWKTSEGVEIQVPYKGPVKPILKDIEGGLRSSFTYIGAKNLKEFQKKCSFMLVSNSTSTENKPHGQKR